jgi:hypothetical protein
MHSRILAALTLSLIPLLASAQETATPASGAEQFHRDHQTDRAAFGVHYILDAQHALRPEERSELAAMGVDVQQSLTNGRYLVHVRPGATFDENDPRVRSLAPLTAERKLQPSAYREAAKTKPFVNVRILFNSDVSFEEARRAVIEAGGAVSDPLMGNFAAGLPRRIEARIAPGAILGFANDERVLTIYGRQPKMAIDNATSALLSKVTPLFSAPYGLSGKGVVLSSFELAAADSSHREFGGRLQVHTTGGSADDIEHATHTSGTMIAAGIDPNAKGMAPQANLVQFNARNNYLEQKAMVADTYHAIADNNSWGFVFGWSQDGSGNWIWNEGEEFIAAYDDNDAAIDHITRASNLLFVHSAGNDGSNPGPGITPFVHYHVDDNGDADTTKVFCYSPSGAGGDCPTQCNTALQCETVAHPVHNPFGSLGMTAASKNVIAVGATDTGRNIANFSSRGPTKDGRVKPDLTARGVSTFSTLPNNNYGRKNGTSMAAPVVTGVSALITEQWRNTFGGASPLAATIKALLIAGADDLGLPGPDFTYGFGFTDAQAAVDLIRADNASGSNVRVAQLTQGQSFEVPLTITSAGNLRVVAVWTDPEVLNLSDFDTAANALVNDLDLKIVDPNGNAVLPYVLNPNAPTTPATRGVNSVDNIEEVEIANAPAGSYRAVVTAKRIGGLDPAQQFVLVSSGGAMGTEAPTCSDLYEPNDTEATAYGSLVRNTRITARLCSAADVDFYSMRVTGSGPASVTVTATDTPLRVTILGSGIVANSVTLAAGETKSVSTQVGNGTGQAVNPAQTVTVKVEANGSAGATGTYTLTPSYGALTTTRRAAGH